ncbi:hypothetical protein Pfo_026034 [Paulownia fortunei]|nr:hypothetical protein Pfo_026034 [Paulownia fortunei]
MGTDQQLRKSYVKKQQKKLSATYPFHYILQEQRFVCLLIGIAIACVVFNVIPSLSPSQKGLISASDESTPVRRRLVYDGFSHLSAGGRIPLGLKSKNLRILVTGGAGFVGSHLVDCLIARGDSVIVVDNFFTGRKENLLHHYRNPRFELIRHDVVEPILLEVDQIYHLACPASPVHYKYNPVKTIISLSIFEVLVLETLN